MEQEQIVFAVVNQPNRYCMKGQIARYESGHYVWDEEQNVRSHHAVVATSSGRPVGVLKFNVRREDDGTLVMRSVGTFVWQAYRHLGIGKQLWHHALQSYDFSAVRVNVVSDKGKTLVESLRGRYPHLKFSVDENGDRPLRDLKGNKIKKIRGWVA